MPTRRLQPGKTTVPLNLTAEQTGSLSALGVITRPDLGRLLETLLNARLPELLRQALETDIEAKRAELEELEAARGKLNGAGSSVEP